MNESTLKKMQALAMIGSGVVAFHGVTTRRWQRSHTAFVGLGLAASIGLFVLPRFKSSSDQTRQG